MPGKTSTGFDSVPLDSAVKHECSPQFEKFDAEIRGIKLNAPGIVEAVFDEEKGIVSPTTRFPVCIAMQFPLKLMADIPRPRPLITLVMVNKATGESFSSNLAYSRPMGPLPAKKMPPEVVEKSIRRFYFNVNLSSYMKLPASPAAYLLYATFQEFKSNVMSVKLVEKQ